jgi:glutaminyl-peptide cyclotransferase
LDFYCSVMTRSGKNLYNMACLVRFPVSVFALAMCVISIVSCGKKIPVFNGDNAFMYLTAQTGFGPRNLGSAGHVQCRDYILGELSKTADLVNRQEFTFTDEYSDSSFALTNIIASFNLSPPNARRILIAAHWDTRPFADSDSLSGDKDKPIPGANDGASGVAVLLEFAAVLKENPPPIGVDIVLFDGEDYGRTAVNGLDYYFLGSKHFVETKGTYQPDYAILLDMVGSAEPQFYIEGYSNYYAPVIVEKIWSKAKSLEYSVFVDQVGPSINDDHVILNRAGIPTVDIIDINLQRINYPYWHTLDDTPEKCSPETLAQIGNLLLHLIYE